MDFYQWEVVRSVRINEETHSDIHKISGRGIGIKENRHGLEGQRHIKLKYNVSSEILKEWNTGPLGNLLRDYKRLGMDKIPKRDDYIVSNHNLLKNDGEILYDQIPHRDDPPRSN